MGYRELKVKPYQKPKLITKQQSHIKYIKRVNLFEKINITLNIDNIISPSLYYYLLLVSTYHKFKATTSHIYNDQAFLFKKYNTLWMVLVYLNLTIIWDDNLTNTSNLSSSRRVNILTVTWVSDVFTEAWGLLPQFGATCIWRWSIEKNCPTTWEQFIWVTILSLSNGSHFNHKHYHKHQCTHNLHLHHSHYFISN